VRETLDVRRAGGVGDPSGGGDSARAGDVGLDVAQCVAVEIGVEPLLAGDALAGGQRHLDPGAQPVVGLRIGPHRLLEEVDSEVGVGEPAPHPLGLGDGVGVVCVHHQPGVGRDLADGSDPLDVGLRPVGEVAAEPDLHLQRVEPGVDVAAGLLPDRLALGRQRVDVPEEMARRVRPDALPAAPAEQRRHREVDGLPVEIPQREVDAADDARGHVGVVRRAQVDGQLVVEAFDLAGVLAHEPGGGVLLDDLAVAGDRPPALAPPDAAVVRLGAHQTVLPGVDPLLGVGEPLVQFPAQRDRLDGSQFHRRRGGAGRHKRSPATATDW